MNKKKKDVDKDPGKDFVRMLFCVSGFAFTSSMFFMFGFLGLCSGLALSLSLITFMEGELK